MKGTTMVAIGSFTWAVRASLSVAFLSVIVCAQTAWAQRTFETADAAAQALIKAAKANDEKALVDIFGEKYRSLVVTVDQKADQENRAKFARDAADLLTMRRDADDKVTLVVGFDAWPMPIPIVRQGATWHFDAAAGSEEILNRRIGRNELAAIDVLRAYVKAQRQYAAKPRDGSRVRAFARKVGSSPGKHDGLYWPADAGKGEEVSPFGPLIRDPDKHKRGSPYNGYYFKILTRQGSAAPGGPYSYIINGRMVAGFAMVAAPADYGDTGINTFIVNHYGEVYERDLGPNTLQTFRTMTEYNPTGKWKLVE